MYKVLSNNGLPLNSCETLDGAMTFAKTVGTSVVIKGNGIEIVGTFGSDSVDNGLLPNGDPYTWYKRRNPLYGKR